MKIVTVDTDNDEDNPAVVNISDMPGIDPGALEVKKIDKETGEAAQNGDASLAGAQFTVKYYAGYYDKESQLPSNATRSWVLETKTFVQNGKPINRIQFADNYKVGGDEFYKIDGKVVIPYGTITIEETKAPDGYKIEDSTVSVNGKEISGRKWMSKVEAGKELDTVAADFTVSDPSKMYGIQVWKSDKELDQSEAIGGKDHIASEDGATLAGVEFSVINRSSGSVSYKGKDYAPGEEIMKLTTKWNEDLKKYVAQTEDKTLPYGTYGIKEVKSSQGYLLTDGTEKAVVCHGEDGHMYTPDDLEELNFKNQVIRGDYEFLKKAFTGQKSLSAAFKVTNVTSGESHVIVTDKNGEYDSTANKHSENTNANDKLLDDYDEKTGVKASDFDLNAGTWFGQGEDGTVAKVDDSKSAFVYGKYEVEELRSDTNKGMKLVKYDFYITKDGKKVNGGTINDEDELTPAIHTTAKDMETGTNLSMVSDQANIIDTVTYENIDLSKGKEFQLVGVLMDKETETPLLDKDGKEIQVKKTFTANSKNGTVEVDFHFDASNLAGKDIVVFETLLRGDEVIAVHKDINDEGQTIKFPEIHTTAKDGKTESNLVKAEKDMEIVDTVSYKNLIPGKTYTVIGKLVDQKTGKVIVDDNGKEVTSTAKFTAETADGSVQVVFRFDGVNLAGTTMVAFEEVQYQGKTVAVHADIKDEAQTVYVPEIKTNATDKETGDHISLAEGKRTIVDAVSYKNLIVGKEYTIVGKVMDVATGKALLIDGKEVTATKKFTAEKSEGSVELEFTFDASTLMGKDVVVFEDAYVKGVPVATHSDLNDKNQTVSFPKIKTNATDKEDGDHKAVADEKVTIVDEVTYNNLIPGVEYEMVGKLMNRETGKSLKIDGKEVIVSKKFTPKESSGSVKLSFTFDGSKLAGKDVVVFETTKIAATGKVVAKHQDINDKGQTVKLISPDKNVPSVPHSSDSTSTGVKTGQDSILPMIAGVVMLIVATVGVIVWRKKSKETE